MTDKQENKPTDGDIGKERANRFMFDEGIVIVHDPRKDKTDPAKGDKAPFEKK